MTASTSVLNLLGQTLAQTSASFGNLFVPLLVLAAAAAALFLLWLLRVQQRPGSASPGPRAAPASRPPLVDLVIPVLNEAHVLEKSVATVRAFLHERFPYPARVTIADNGSTDGTRDIARRLSETYDDVRYITLPQRGRGRALRTAWTQSDADIMAYTDVDLSTDLEALEPLCRAIQEENYEIGTGSRLLRGAQVQRCFKREMISRLYNLFIKCVLFTRFSDAQCGFKVVSRRVVQEIVPLIKDQAWFFDTELLVLGEKLGYPVKDLAARWIEDPDSRVKVVSTAWEDIKGVFRLRKFLWSKAFHNLALQLTVKKPVTSQ